MHIAAPRGISFQNGNTIPHPLIKTNVQILLLHKSFFFILFLIPAGYTLYLLFSGYFWKAFGIFAFTSFVGSILFLAIRDAQKKLKDKNDD